METKLESSGVKPSPIGLGIEHFARRSRVLGLSRDENSKKIILEAFKLGITHFDVVFNLPYFFEIFKEFIKGKREKITFTTHLGSYYTEKLDHSKTRSLSKIQSTYESMLNLLDIDYADIALIQFVTNLDDYQQVIKNGVLDYAYKLKEEGKAKAVGLSAHNPELLLKIIAKSDLDVIMTPINFATGSLPAMKKLLEVCKKEGISIIAIKNLLKGKAFTTKPSDYSAYYSGGKKFKLKLDRAATPADCMNYALNLGVNCVVFGVKNVDELIINMNSFNSQKGSKGYTYFEQAFKKKIEELHR